ncbi:MAG TPA: hypothetical protein VK684_10360 [Edaphobacter sp.]|jgi:hypothetical protein|nr:hypothetical protein [Edaphobacter sp.]
MKKLTGLLAGGCLVFLGLVSCPNVAAAQDGAGVPPPPKVLVIQREVLKPGRAGNTHLKTEGAFVQAMTAAKWPTHYFAVESLSGVSRALFLLGYPSFAAWEKDNADMAKNATLTAAFDHASLVDGEQLSEFSSGVFLYNEEDSLRANVDIAHMRYFEISQFRVKAGHQKDWNDLVKMYKSGYEKVPNAKWAVFESMYGMDNGGLYLVFNPMRSLAEVDEALGDSKKFEAALGPDGMKKLSELTALCIESSQTNLFQFNPKMSYPAEEWIKADPSFWAPKMAVAAKKTTAP